MINVSNVVDVMSIMIIIFRLFKVLFNNELILLEKVMFKMVLLFVNFFVKLFFIFLEVFFNINKFKL